MVKTVESELPDPSTGQPAALFSIARHTIAVRTNGNGSTRRRGFGRVADRVLCRTIVLSGPFG